MTKSTITRERLEQLADNNTICKVSWDERIELARMALAAMDSEPVAEVVSIYGDPEAFGEREIRPLVGIQQMPYGTKLYRHAQPAPEYPETLPCPVLLEPGLRFGKGVKTILVLEAIQRRAEHYAELEAMPPEERAEYDAGIEAFKAMLPQSATVVAEEATPDSIEILASARRRDHAAFQWDEDQRNAAADSWNACRAAMLQELQKSAGVEATCRCNENVQAVEVQSLTSINPAPDLVSLQKKAESIIGNYPGIPDDSEHCPCCGKKLRRACSVEGCGGKHVAHGLCQKHYDMKRWEDPEQVERFREAGRRYRGKKKSTEATPQEPKP